MSEVARRYSPPQTRCALPGSRPERTDERAARMLGCSAEHAKKLRLTIIPEAIVAILTACIDDSSKAETFRRHCLTALSAEPSPSLTPDLILDATEASAAVVVAMQAATVDGTITEEERRTLVRLQREELGADATLIRALENA